MSRFDAQSFWTRLVQLKCPSPSIAGHMRAILSSFWSLRANNERRYPPRRRILAFWGTLLYQSVPDSNFLVPILESKDCQELLLQTQNLSPDQLEHVSDFDDYASWMESALRLVENNLATLKETQTQTPSIRSESSLEALLDMVPEKEKINISSLFSIQRCKRDMQNFGRY